MEPRRRLSSNFRRVRPPTCRLVAADGAVLEAPDYGVPSGMKATWVSSLQCVAMTRESLDRPFPDPDDDRDGSRGRASSRRPAASRLASTL